MKENKPQKKNQINLDDFDQETIDHMPKLYRKFLELFRKVKDEQTRNKFNKN